MNFFGFKVFKSQESTSWKLSKLNRGVIVHHPGAASKNGLMRWNNLSCEQDSNLVEEAIWEAAAWTIQRSARWTGRWMGCGSLLALIYWDTHTPTQEHWTAPTQAQFGVKATSFPQIYTLTTTEQQLNQLPCGPCRGGAIQGTSKLAWLLCV